MFFISMLRRPLRKGDRPRVALRSRFGSIAFLLLVWAFVAGPTLHLIRHDRPHQHQGRVTLWGSLEAGRSHSALPHASSAQPGHPHGDDHQHQRPSQPHEHHSEAPSGPGHSEGASDHFAAAFVDPPQPPQSPVRLDLATGIADSLRLSRRAPLTGHRCSGRAPPATCSLDSNFV